MSPEPDRRKPNLSLPPKVGTPEWEAQRREGAKLDQAYWTQVIGEIDPNAPSTILVQFGPGGRVEAYDPNPPLSDDSGLFTPRE